MSRRTRTTAIFLVLLLALVVVAPALPIVRDAIVTRVLGSLSGSGVSITYRATSGNAWRSITLHDVEARGLGADVRLETLTIGYFLPSLLGGELPIDVLVAGATGDVDVKQLLDDSMGDASDGAAGPISLRLRKIDLQDIGVSLAQVPFTLPDANIGSLSVTQDGTVLDLGAVVSTADGEATIAGRYDALTSVFTGRVTQADATIARHWWDGVTAGNLTGTVTIRGSTIDGDFVLEGGAVDDLGLTATDVSGDVTMRYPVITAELDGNVFGGRVAATGVVNVTAERWEANGGGTADLGQAADWLARSLLPDGVPLPMTGSVVVDLTVVGWEEIDLQGSASGNGTLGDMPIEGLRATFAVAEDGDLTVDANAVVGGGPLALTIGPDARGDRIVATATDVLLAIDGNDLGTLNATLDMAADGPQNGSLLASWRADLAGRTVNARVDGRLDPDGWQAFVTGRDDLGTSLEGAIVLADGLIQGAVTVVDIAGLPLSSGARVVVAASGPVSEPTLTVTLAGDQPVTLAVGPPELLLFDDLRGSLTGTVSGTSVPDVVGAFGPVRVSGTLGLSPIAADLALTLDERTFAFGDTASALVAITESVLRIDPDGATWNGAISTTGVSVGPLLAATGVLNASASFGGAAGQDAADGVGQPWSVTLIGTEGTFVATVDPTGLVLDLDDLAVSGSSPDVPLDARLSGTMTSLPGDGGGSAFDRLGVNATVAGGSTFGPTRLADDLALSGVVELAEALATIEGSTGPLGLDLRAAFGSGADTTVEASLTSGAAEPLSLTVDTASGRFSLSGAADPLALLAALDLAPAGNLNATATADLSGTLTGSGLADLAGAIDLELTEPLALNAQLVGAGTSLVVAVDGGTTELPIAASGTLDLTDLTEMTRALSGDEGGSTAEMSVTLGPLSGIVVTPAGAAGSGVFDLGAVGPVSVEPLPWNLTADWTDVEAPYATITSGTSSFTLTLDDGQPLLEGSAALPLAYAGEHLVLNLAVDAAGSVPIADVGALPLRGTLDHPATGATLLAFQGTASDLLVSGDVPTALLAAPLPEQARVDGALRVDAEVDLLAGPDYSAQLALSAAGTSFTGTISGSGSDVRADLDGDDLQLTFDGDTLSVTADQASLAPFLGGADEAPAITGTVDGRLAYDPAAGWSGTLVAALALRLAGVTDSSDPLSTTSDVTATATLRGRGGTLELVATGTGPADSRLTATGSLAPDLAVSAEVVALDEAVTAVLDYRTDPGLTGTLTTTSFAVEGYAEVPAQRADLTWQPGSPLRLTGPGIDLTADIADSGAPLSGTLELPFTLLDGPAHLTAEVGGSLAAPGASLEVVGPGLHAVGTGTLSAAEATLSIEEPAFTRLLPDLAGQFAGLIASPVTADAHWSAGDGWTLVANSLVGPADSPDQADPGQATLDLDLAGAGAAYSGALAVSLGGHGVASVSIAGVGSDLAAALDLADVEWDAIARRFGIDVSVVGGGQARFTTAPLDATLDIDMSGTAAGLGITLRGTAPNDLAFTVNGVADTGGTVDLSGRLAWDQEQKAVVTGSIGGKRVDASLTLDDALSTGRLLVDVPGARVIADLSTPNAIGAATEPDASADATNMRRDVSVTATLDGTSFGGLAGDLSAAITNEGGVTTLDSLRADTSVLPGLGDALPLTLDASGVLTPAPEVVGTVTAPTLGETARLHVSSGPQAGATSDNATTGTTVELSWRDLLAVFDVASSRLHLTGEAELGDVAAPFLPDTLSGLSANVLEADLTWSPSEGFGGALEATIDAPVLDGTGIARPVRLQASALVPPVFAPADLAVWLDVRATSGVRLATLDVTVPADPLAASALSGGLNLDTDLADLLDLPQLDLRLTGSAAFAGTLSDPAVTGTLELAGDVTAAGEFGYVAGAASLDLNGPDLSVTADYADSAWSADATIDRLPLGAWITQVADPYLSLRARADSSGGARVTVEDLVIESDASRLTGAATIDSGLRVLLQAQVDLRDLRVAGTEFHGLLRGPVIVTAPTLDELAAANITAQVDAAGVGVAAVDASVSGSIQFGGSVSDPIVNAVLRGNGALSGGLRLDAAPGRGRLQVRSDLAFAGLDTDFDLNIDGGAAQARGQLRFGAAVLLLSDDEGVAALTGAGRLDGWSVTVAAGFAGATITGPLDRLVPGSTGAVDVSVGVTAPAGDPSAEPEPWLSGTIGDLALGGQRLGDLRLTSDALGQPITLTGETISASFAPANSDWSLSLEGQTLPGDVVVDVAGTGSGMAGTLSGSVRGSGSLPLDVAVTVSVGEGVALSVAGQALGGSLAVTGQRASLASGTWTGDVALVDGTYAGVAFQVVGTLFGEELVPQALLTTSASLAAADPAADAGAVAGADADAEADAGATLALAGLISVGPQGITVDQQVDAAPLADRLRLRGRLTSPTDLVVSSADESSWRLYSGGATLRASGALALGVGPAELRLGAERSTGIPTVDLSLASTPSLSASAELVGADLIEVLNNVARDGLVFEGEGAARGSIGLSVSPTPRAVLQGFGATFAGFDIQADGTMTADATELTGTVILPAEVPAIVEQGQLSLPWSLVGAGADWRLDSTGDLGTVSADIDLDTLATRIEVDVALPGAAAGSGSVVERGITSGSVVGHLTYDPTVGATGSFAIADVVLAPAAVGTVSVNADVAVAGGLISGAASIDTSGGRVTLTGNAAIAELIPGLDLAGFEAASGSNLELRVRTLDLGLIPGIADTVPHVNGALSGVVQLRNGVVLGQLVAPELAVGERLMPASLQLSGVPSSLDAALVVAGTLISGELDAGRLTGSARLERFPLELVAEAFVGPSDVTASLTGVLRFDVPLDDAASGFMRVATEEVRLERAGVVTLGNLTLTYDDSVLSVERAEFGGRGAWQASGVLSPELLDFRLEAEDADFSPLLGLFPDLALYAVGAAGSFTFTASGSFAAPQMSLESDALDIGFAGTRYRIEGTSATLDGVDLTAETTVRGLDPLVGALDFSGTATVMLEPLALRFVDFGFAGSLSVPGFGVVEGINGVISQDQQNNPMINLSGMLGAPVNVSGTLIPLDIRAGGTGLNLSLPALLIGDASLDLDLRLRGEEGGVSLGGAVVAEEIILDLAARAPEPVADPSVAVDGATESASALSTSEQVAATEAQGARNALAALRFDGLRITAPQRVVLAMNIANIEAALDLTVSGTAADPRLDGTAEALRGSLRFSGREFTFDRGVATFSASRGVFPELAIVATTEFEKSRVLTGAQGVRFVSPSDGQTFTVGLAITGPVEAAPPAEGGFRFDVRPVLTSEALIEIEGEGVGTGVRPLTEAELLSLITLGRVDFEAGIIGAGGLGGAVAQGALDTAVDLLIVGELQNALREALGLDVVEIRTSAISSLLGGDAEQFGVSVRLGGYLNPELFASYRIGTADPGDPTFALTNEVALSYALGPLDLDLVGRIDFPTAGTLASPRPELGVGLRYDFGRALGLDAGVTLSTQRSVVSFGVALRW